AALSGLRRPLRQLADRCRARGGEETDRLIGRRGKLLALYEPALAEVPGLENHPEPAELPPEAGRLRLFTELTQTFLALAQTAPLLLMMDDLHWADELTLDWLEFLSRSPGLSEAGLVVLASIRTDEAGSHPMPLRRLMDAPGVQRINLRRLQ